MAKKFDKQTVERWKGIAQRWLSTSGSDVRSPAQVLEGSSAWFVAHRCGITAEAYADRSVTDGHIQTALEEIFPNVIFRDKKVY